MYTHQPKNQLARRIGKTCVVARQAEHGVTFAWGTFGNMGGYVAGKRRNVWASLK